MKALFPEKVHYYIYVFALMILVAGLPLSKFLMSLSQIILACNWLLEGDLKNKFTAFWKNKTALIVSSILLLHFIGLTYTSDFSYAFKDIRIKAPLFILPLIVSTSKPLSQKLFDTVLQLLVGAVIIGTIISSLILIDVIHRPVIDIRDISIFISHIRFALLICVAIFISSYFIFKAQRVFSKIIWTGVIIWMVYFLIIMESITGLMALSVTLVGVIIYTALKSSKNPSEPSKNKLFRYGTLLLLLGSMILLAFYINSIAAENKQKEIVDFNKLETHTSLGNLYEHDIQSEVSENGHLIWMYYSIDELKEAWNKRSVIKIDSTDLKGNSVYFTLFRFLTSKGLRKDAQAVFSLTENEIKAIERGVTNVNYPDVSSLKGRIYETLWEIDLYAKTGQVNGHSLTQRLEYWRTALSIINNNFFLGVGTGDVPRAFEQEYIKKDSSLGEKWRLRSHNQYLAITVAFGIIGLLWFLITLIYPLLNKKTGFNYMYITFFIIAVFSFFTEDTLETQAGVTFFAFLNSFLLFAKKKSGEEVPPQNTL
ncbi:MAG: O-antigen ligase family protein [Bacteroidia bacterium]|nr:O-antigen ligase family protein [Bacteroidia bacterium]